MTTRKTILRYLDCNLDEYGKRSLPPDYSVFDELVVGDDGAGEIFFEPRFSFVASAYLVDGGPWPRHIDFQLEFTNFVTTAFRQNAMATKLNQALPALAQRLGIERIVYRAKDAVVSATEAVLDCDLFYSQPHAVLTVLAENAATAEKVTSIASAIDDILQAAAGRILELEDGVESSEPQFYRAPSRPRVFVCHSSRDKATARKLCTELRKSDIEPWIDDEQIAIGDDFVKAMERGLTECDFVTVLLTPNFLAGPWAQEEYRSSLEKQIRTDAVRILPALFETCDIPTFLTSKRYADFRTNFKDGVTSLARTIKTRYEAHKRGNTNA